MYETQAILKNINLRNELHGEDKHGAFDLKFETMLTPELHARLCGHPEEQVSPSQLRKSGLTEVKYNTEIENIKLTFGKQEVQDAKLNKVVAQIGTDYKVIFRVQAQIHQRGQVEDLNDMVGEPHHLVIEELQGDMLNEAANTGSGSQDEPAKPAPKKKRKASAKKKASKATRSTTSDALHVVGDEGVVLTDEEIEKRETEKARILAASKKSGETTQDAAIQAVEKMVHELESVRMGQGDQHEYKQLAEKVNNGRKLTDLQMDKLGDLYDQYVRAA